MLRTVDNRVQWRADEGTYEKVEDRKPIRITLADFQTAGVSCRLLAPHAKLQTSDDNDALIIAVMSTGPSEVPLITTGNFIGEFTYAGRQFSIGSRFSDVFLKRILNFSNDIYFDDVDALPLKKSDSASSFSRLILRYLFVQSLEKAYLLGLPKAYTAIHDDSLSVKGRLNISRFIQQAIPFRGKLPTISREMMEVPDIVDTLYKALQIVERGIADECSDAIKRSKDKSKKQTSSDVLENVRHVINHLREARSGKSFTNEILTRAKTHKALQNPIFSPYKTVLRYAEYIIRTDSMQQSKANVDVNFSGFLVNVAELFEIYVTKLLQRSLPDCKVHSPEIVVHAGKFFERKIIPDIVIENEKKILVFDTKYKRMKFMGRSNCGMGDLDRADFFQINTYMAHYAHQSEKTLIAGGLIYPICSTIPQNRLPEEDHWSQNPEVKFCVHGIRTPTTESKNEDDVEKIISSESERNRKPIEIIKESEIKLIEFIQAQLSEIATV